MCFVSHRLQRQTSYNKMHSEVHSQQGPIVRSIADPIERLHAYKAQGYDVLVSDLQVDSNNIRLLLTRWHLFHVTVASDIIRTVLESHGLLAPNLGYGRQQELLMLLRQLQDVRGAAKFQRRYGLR